MYVSRQHYITWTTCHHVRGHLGLCQSNYRGWVYSRPLLKNILRYMPLPFHVDIIYILVHIDRYWLSLCIIVAKPFIMVYMHLICAIEICYIGIWTKIVRIGLSPGPRQVSNWTNAGTLLIGRLGTEFSEISIGIQAFSFTKCTYKCRLRNGVHSVSASTC